MAYTTINKPSDHFNTKLYTGNGSTQSITGVGFQPDWVWTKRRDNIGDHSLYDVIRGTTKRLEFNTEDAENTVATSLTSFDSDGFTLGSGGDSNGNTETYLSWNWLAGGTGVSNNDGSITSTVSANTTSGFSVVQWTGTSNATIGHGLGQKPSMVITKSKSNSAPWLVWHKGLTGSNEEDRYVTAPGGATQATYTDYWGTGGFTSTVFGVNGDGLNNNLGDMIAYCFAEKKGYSKFGTYTGNQNADGPFIYTGFKPAFTMIKNVSSAYDWLAQDSTRQADANFDGNPVNILNQWNANNAESNATTRSVDYLSNGFKIRNSSVAWNENSSLMIYMAFAENPLVGTNNVVTTAK